MAILYYMHDVIKLAHIRNRMKFCAHCAVSMFQNVSNGRQKKEIIVKDHRYISSIASLPFYCGGVRQYEIGMSRRYYDGPLSGVTLCYIKGTGKNIAQIIWIIANYYYRNPSLRENIVFNSGSVDPHGNNFFLSSRKYGVDYNTDEIYPGLTIERGEVKIIADTYLYIDTNIIKLDGTCVNPNPWGFFIFNPKPENSVTGHNGYFHTVEIFTQKPGLFSETPPK